MEKRKIVLHIDTSSNEEIVVVLEIEGKKDELREKIGKEKAQVVLPLIETLLINHSLQLSDISEIKVNAGPGGSFTGLRVGVAIANALSFCLQIPVNGTREVVEVVYE